jgi:hypothetical protein
MCSAPHHAPMKATPFQGGRSRPALTGAAGAHAYTRRLRGSPCLTRGKSQQRENARDATFQHEDNREEFVIGGQSGNSAHDGEQ